MNETAAPRPAAMLPGRGLRLSAELVSLLVVFGLLAVYVLRSMYGIDVFWHIKAGELIYESGSIPNVDTFSAVHPDKDWTSFQWLYEVLVYFVDGAGGYWALRILHAGLLIVGFALMYRAIRRQTGPVLALFVLVLTIAFFEDRFRVRPHVFNLFFLATLLPVIFGRWKELRWPGLLGVGVVAWIWANIHAGGALLVPVSLGGLLAGAGFRWLVIDRNEAHRRELFAALRLFVVAVGPMLLMPGFLHGVWTAISMYGASVALIPEWQDPTAYFDLLDQRGRAHNLISGFGTYATMTVFGLWVVVGVLRKRIAEMPWPEIAVSVLFLYLGQRSLRFIYLNAIPITVMLRSLDRRLAAETVVRWRPAVVRGAFALLAVGVVASSYQYNIVVQRGGLAEAIARIPQHLEPSRFPVEAADFLDQAELRGKVFHYSKWGGYLLYKLWPRCSVFSDGRGNFDVVQVGAMVATHRPLEREVSLEKAWNLYGFDFVVFPGPVFPLMDWDRERWVRIYAGMEHNAPVEVFLRNSPENMENLLRVRKWYERAAEALRARHAPNAPRDTRFLNDDLHGDLVALEQAIQEYWGRQWLSRPPAAPKMARYSATIDSSAPPEERAKALFKRAMLLYSAGALGQALSDLSTLVELSPTDVRAAYYLGWTLYRVGRYQEAGAALVEAARREQAAGRPVLRSDERRRGDLLIGELKRRLR